MRSLAMLISGSLCLLIFAGPVLAQPTTVTPNPFKWTDRYGTNVHVAQGYEVEFWEEDTFADDLMGTTTTNNSGFATVTYNDDDGLLDYTLEVYTKLYARIPGVASVRDTYNGNVYNIQSATANVPLTGSILGTANNVVADNTTNAGTAMQILAPIKFMHDYYTNTHIATLPELQVAYNSTITGAAIVDPGGPTQHMELRYNAWGNWDVIMHEYGHYLANENNLDSDANWGGDHSWGRDNIGKNANGRDAGANTGRQRGYGEGVATFLGLMAVKEGNLATAIPGLPAEDYDTKYHRFDPPNNSSTTTNAHLTFANDIEVGGGNAGEGDEASVARAMWDFYDNTNENLGNGLSDKVSLGANRTWINMVGADIFDDYWRAVAADVEADPTLAGLAAGAKKGQIYTTLGEILEAHDIANEPVTSGQIFDFTPTLRFVEGNNNNSDQYGVVIFDTNWNIVADAYSTNVNDQEVGLANYDMTITTPLAKGTYYWAALNRTAGVTGVTGNFPDYYWSSYHTIEIIPEPASLALLGLGGLALLRRR